jgi:hypothetical protein
MDLLNAPQERLTVVSPFCSETQNLVPYLDNISLTKEKSGGGASFLKSYLACSDQAQ